MGDGAVGALDAKMGEVVTRLSGRYGGTITPPTPSDPPKCLHSIGIETWEDFSKVLTVSFFCFTANTILLLGRNIGATMLLTGLSADALPYTMVLVGVFIIFIMPITAHYVNKFSSGTVLTVMT